MVRSQTNAHQHKDPTAICQAKTLNMVANKEENQSILKYVVNEPNLGRIKSETTNKVNMESTYESALGDDLLQFEDAILADVIVDHLISKLNKLKDSIENSESSYGLLVKDLYPKMYQHKKELIAKHINALNLQEEEQIVNF